MLFNDSYFAATAHLDSIPADALAALRQHREELSNAAPCEELSDDEKSSPSSLNNRNGSSRKVRTRGVSAVHDAEAVSEWYFPHMFHCIA